MAKRRYTTEYVDVKRMLKSYDTTYYILFGQREDGKSYAVKKEIIEYISQGFNFVYLRRLHKQIVRKQMLKVFDDIQWYALELLGSKIYYDTQLGFHLIIDGEKKPVGYCTALDDTMTAKSIPITNIKIILFDEFIDYMYGVDEIPKFLHCISTICRPPNENVKIFMLGNTISKNCPYFKLFGIDINRIKQGEIYYISHSLGVTAAVQHTATKVDDLKTKSKKNKYIGFDDNESVNMIMFGEWEYKHCNTDNIDGITWNCMRHFVPIYFTAIEQVYEFTLYTDGKLPILFVRKVNTQNGMVKTKVKYNLSYDNTVILTNNNGIVPIISKINSLIDSRTLSKWELSVKCFECGRVVYDSVSTGSEIMSLLMGVKR